MQPTQVTVRRLFNSEIQFKIPLFQRHYVWDREGQWQPLWEDIKEKSERRLSDSQKDATGHFTGAIVIQQTVTSSSEVPKYQIIDGQQRLTTFQIILCALRDICKQQNFGDTAKQIEDLYLLNKARLTESEEKYKLIPTDFDKDSLLNIVDVDYKASSPNKGKIHDAYKYFQTAIQEYAEYDEERVRSLYHSVLDDFGLVEILIDENDEPEVIFESLNARRKSLLQFDLLRNNIFLRTPDDDRDALYKKYWKHFETEYWEKEVGKNKPALSELFLQHFLMAKLGEHSVSPLFRTYQRRYQVSLSENQDIEHELAELHRYSKQYQIITDCDEESDIGSLMRFYKIFDITSLHPFILYLLNDSGLDNSKNKDDILLTLRILESYTIRRMFCTRQGHKNYNKFFSGIIKELISKKSRFSVKLFASVLSGQEDDTYKWPNNDDVKASLSGSWAGTITSKTAANKIMRYILYRIELLTRKENRFSEKDELPFQQFTLEHIMPLEWEENWLLPNGDGFLSRRNLYSKEVKGPLLLTLLGKVKDPLLLTLLGNAKEYLADPSYSQAHKLTVGRDSSLQNIGNLTIVTGGLNASMSNSSYDKKREKMFSNSTLMLNKAISKSASWDVKEIKERGDLLYEKFCQIWHDSKWFEDNMA